MEVMIVDNNACNEKCFTALDVSFFSSLKVFEVGDYSCAFVDEVMLIGLNQLERVVIGLYSFGKWCKLQKWHLFFNYILYSYISHNGHWSSLSYSHTPLNA